MNDKCYINESINCKLLNDDNTVHLHKIDFKKINDDEKDLTKNIITWNPIIEKNALEIGEKAKGYKIMHTRESEIVSSRYDILMFSGIILGPLSGLLSSIGAMLEPQQTCIILPIISACVGFLSGIIVAITKYGKYEEKSSKHKLAASKYTSLESNVRRQLALCRSDRVNAVQYLEWIGNSFDELFLASPLVAKKIYRYYVEIAKENGLEIPDEYKITINIDEKYTDMKIKEMADISKININIEEESPKLIKLIKSTKSIKYEPKIDFVDNEIKSIELNRSDTLNILPELNKFSDGRMQYELNRMIQLH